MRHVIGGNRGSELAQKTTLDLNPRHCYGRREADVDRSGIGTCVEKRVAVVEVPLKATRLIKTQQRALGVADRGARPLRRRHRGRASYRYTCRPELRPVDGVRQVDPGRRRDTDHAGIRLRGQSGDSGVCSQEGGYCYNPRHFIFPLLSLSGDRSVETLDWPGGGRSVPVRQSFWTPAA